MPEVLPTINAEPPQGIQSILDIGYIWNPYVANELISKINELLEKVEGLRARIYPYEELPFPIAQYTPCYYGDSVYVAATDIDERPADFDPSQWIEIASKSGKLPEYLSVERLGDYLYKVTFDSVPEELDPEENVIAGSCSSFVRDGKLYRNFDMTYDNNSTFKVVCPGFEGIAVMFNMPSGNIDISRLKYLPQHIVDGVNSHGIMVSTHIVFNDWQYQGSGEKFAPCSLIPTAILNNVESINQLGTVLGDFIDNMKIPASLATTGYLMQFLVTDGTTTYAILPPTSADGKYSIQNITANPKLTNFRWVSDAIVDRANLQTRPTGVERWNSIGTDTTLEDLRFTDCYVTASRLSEFIGIDETTKDSTDAELEEIFDRAHAIYINGYRGDGLWQTVHSVVYGEGGMEHLWCQENWEKDYISASSAEWGKIGGDIEDQADLKAKFDGIDASIAAEAAARQAADAEQSASISALGQTVSALSAEVATKASNERVAAIEEKIPSTATAQNQLADKDFVNSSIQNMAANYITSTTTGDPFATRAALVAGPWYYKGAAKAPTNNDYALVTEDETHEGLTSRYMYDSTQWVWQYVLNDTKFTQAQLDAINSTITKNKLDTIEGDISDIQGEIATYGDIVTHDADEFATPSDVSSAVAAHNSDNTAHSDIRTALGDKEPIFRYDYSNLPAAGDSIGKIIQYTGEDMGEYMINGRFYKSALIPGTEQYEWFPIGVQDYYGAKSFVNVRFNFSDGQYVRILPEHPVPVVIGSVYEVDCSELDISVVSSNGGKYHIIVENSLNSYTARVFEASGDLADAQLGYAGYEGTFLYLNTPAGTTGYYDISVGAKGARSEAGCAPETPMSEFTPIVVTEVGGQITASNLGTILQFDKESTSEYINGYFYKAEGEVLPESMVFVGTFEPSGSVQVDDAGALISAIATEQHSSEVYVRQMMAYPTFWTLYWGNDALTSVYCKAFGTMSSQGVLDCFTVSDMVDGPNSFSCTYSAGGLTNTRWEQIDVQPSGGNVDSVNGYTGVVVLDGEDIYAEVDGLTDTIQGHLQTISTEVNSINAMEIIDWEA